MDTAANDRERRHALRYKPAISVRAAYEWLDAEPVSVEGEMTDFSLAGLALQYPQADEPLELAPSGRVSLHLLGRGNEHFDVTLARIVRWSGGHWLAGLSFPKQSECRSRARDVIEHLKAAYRAGAVQSVAAEGGAVARVVGTLNFHVVISLHRLLRSSQPPRSVDLEGCTGADHSGVSFLIMARNQGLDLTFAPGSRVSTLLDR